LFIFYEEKIHGNNGLLLKCYLHNINYAFLDEINFLRLLK